MRRRITFIHSRDHEVPVKSISGSRIEFERPVIGSVEEKLTFSSPVFDHIASLRIHASKEPINKPTDHQRASVFDYAYQIGLHVYAEPKRKASGGDQSAFFQEVNQYVKGLLGSDISEEMWIQSLNAFYYHTSSVPEIQFPHLPILRSWQSVDYYRNGESTVVKVYSSESALTEIDARGSKAFCEVGIFSVEERSLPDDVILSGVRVLLNDKDVNDSESDDEPNVLQTVFHTKPRQRAVDHENLPLAVVKVIPNGLHPILSIDHIPPPPDDHDLGECGLFAYFTLQKSVFLDRYQVPDRLKVLAHYGIRDLELPTYSVSHWGNEILVQWNEINTDPVNITLHSRYQLPSTEVDKITQTIASPILFYACDATVDGHLLSGSAFDNKRDVGGSFERFFTEDSVFYHISERQTFDVSIPTLKGDVSMVNTWTMLALLAGILLVVSSFFSKPRDTEKAKEKEE